MAAIFESEDKNMMVTDNGKFRIHLNSESNVFLYNREFNVADIANEFVLVRGKYIYVSQHLKREGGLWVCDSRPDYKSCNLRGDQVKFATDLQNKFCAEHITKCFAQWAKKYPERMAEAEFRSLESKNKRHKDTVARLKKELLAAEQEELASWVEVENQRTKLKALLET
jgi:hypothetical protein